MSPRRLDRELVERHLVSDLGEAENLIKQHRVLADGSVATKPSTQVSARTNLQIASPSRKYASRGGEKLEGALEDFVLKVTGARCLDAGAGAGGFTDCLLQQGAEHVTAVDVGKGQLDWKLRTDSRVTTIEGVNLRKLEPTDLGETFDLIAADLSFISLEMVMPVLTRALAASGNLLLLVKPQFEAARSQVRPGGLVHDPDVWAAALSRIAAAGENLGLSVAGVAPSRIRGAEGNQEFFLWARADGQSDKQKLIQDAVMIARP